MINFIVSLAAGLLCGMGAGGGVVLIPVLLWLGIPQLTAQGMNLLSYIPAALIAVIMHAKAKRIKWRIVLFMAAGGAVGGACGALAAGIIDTDWLRRIFGGFLIALAIFEWFRTTKEKSGTKQ